MSAIQHPIVELRRFVAGCLRAIRATPHVDCELMLDGAKQIADEVQAERIGAEHKTADLIDRARLPNSPGGRLITADEAERIRDAATAFTRQHTPDVARR